MGTRVPATERFPLQPSGRMALPSAGELPLPTSRPGLTLGACFFLSALTSNSWPSVRSSMPSVGRRCPTWSATILSRMHGILWLPCQILWLSSLPASARGRFTSLAATPPEVSGGGGDVCVWGDQLLLLKLRQPRAGQDYHNPGKRQDCCSPGRASLARRSCVSEFDFVHQMQYTHHF